MSYSDLARLGVTLRPIDHWPADPTSKRSYSPFRSSFSATIGTLNRELRALSAKQIVLQVALEEKDIRLDGLPRANARASHPGVVLAFESKYGPIKFAVDTYVEWEDNLRAIALGMEALRKVDRYGVTKRGEQYTGWRAIPATTDAASSIQTVEQARQYLYRYATADERADGTTISTLLRRALMKTHPDAGGESDEFRKVIRARDLLAGRELLA